MSRHKLVKGLDIDEELDVYDGAEDDLYADGEGEELAPEDKEHLRRGTTEVRNTLGPDFPVTDTEIQDSLYYYYYDVQKTVHYLLSMCQRCPTSSRALLKHCRPKNTKVDATEDESKGQSANFCFIW